MTYIDIIKNLEEEIEKLKKEKANALYKIKILEEQLEMIKEMYEEK